MAPFICLGGSIENNLGFGSSIVIHQIHYDNGTFDFPAHVRGFGFFRYAARGVRMAYDFLDLGNGKQAIRVTFRRTSHIVQNDDGTWTVAEDDTQRVFQSYSAALECARELACDPDLPASTQT